MAIKNQTGQALIEFIFFSLTLLLILKGIGVVIAQKKIQQDQYKISKLSRREFKYINFTDLAKWNQNGN